MFRRAASYVDKILKGANPGDLPVEQLTFGVLAELGPAETVRGRGLIARPLVNLRHCLLISLNLFATANFRGVRKRLHDTEASLAPHGDQKKPELRAAMVNAKGLAL